MVAFISISSWFGLSRYLDLQVFVSHKDEAYD